MMALLRTDKEGIAVRHSNTLGLNNRTNSPIVDFHSPYINVADPVLSVKHRNFKLC
jgi:hypothetical protein